MNRLRLLIIVCLLSTIAGCQKDYNGDVGGASAQGNLDFGYNNIEGGQQYSKQCASCHGVNGNGTSLGESLVSCASCSNISTLAEKISLTMPIGGSSKVEDCDGKCATDVAEYIMYAFNGLNLYQAATSLEGVSAQPITKTLRNATIQLAGRLPSATEIALVRTEGESGFYSVMEDVMNEDEFYARLSEIFNDVFLTDKYLRVNQFNGALNLLDRDDYPNRNWYDHDYPNVEGEEEAQLAQDAINDDNRGCANVFANDAVAREGLELINYIVRNNLPFTELITADYTMVNWYSQKVYDAELLNPSATFRQLDQNNLPCTAYSSYYDKATHTADPSDFKPAKLAGIPHAGILTSAMFLNRFPTTNTNLNRHRSYMVYKMFLDTDILAIEGDRPSDAIDTSSISPTLQNPACFTCHEVMDPVASTFQHWDDRGRYKPDNPWPSSVLAAGLPGKKADISGSGSHYGALLKWLGQEIANDPRYVRAITRHLYKGIIGQDPLTSPGENPSQSDETAYQAQRSILFNIGQAMVADNWNIKTAITGLLLSPYYRAETIDNTKLLASDHIGSTRLLSPEMLQRKLRATLGFDWHELRANDKDNRIMFGGIDSDSVIERIENPSGLMVAMQERMAVDMACRATAFDFTKARTGTINKRRLFRYVSQEAAPYDIDGVELPNNILAIKKNIQYLHNSLLSEDLAIDHPEIESTYQLFLSTWQTGQAMKANPDSFSPRPSTHLYWTCRARWDREDNDKDLADELRIDRDENYVIRSWMAVITYLLSDYRYIYE